MRGRARTNRRGSALVMVVLVISSMAVLSLSLLMTTTSSSEERKGAQRTMGAINVAEAGISQALMDIASGGDGDLGDEDNPVAYGSAEFYVSADTADNVVYTLESVGTESGQTMSVEVTVQRGTDSMFRYAAFGDEGLTMASNAHTDSYDSSKGDYASQAVNGSGADTYALENGDIGSNQDIEMVQNTTVYGDATAGPGGTTTLVGTKTTVTGSTVSATALVELPPLEIPAIGSKGDYTVSGSEEIPSGDYEFDSLEVDSNSKMLVRGPATIVAKNLTIGSNSELWIDSSGGDVEIYVHKDFVMSSNALISSKTGDPSDFQLYLDSDNVIDPLTEVELATVDFKSNSAIYGTVYAPNAKITIDSNFELFGSLVARSVHLDSYAYIHFDENLLAMAAGGSRAFQTLCWRIVGAE